MKNQHHITILFDPPFWIALFERIENNEYSVARAIISTSEPESVEVADFLNNLNFDRLQFTKPIATEKATKEKISFKKQQKLTKKATTNNKIKHTYTKAQTLLKEQQEVNKKERKTLSKLEKEEKEQRKFDLKQKKKKEKHRGH